MPACSNCARTLSSLAHAVDHRREREQLPPCDFSSVRRRRTVCRATLGTRARPAARLRRRCSVRPARMQRRGVRAVLTALQGGISHLAGRAAAWRVTRGTRARRVPPARRRAAPARPRPPTAAAVVSVLRARFRTRWRRGLARRVRQARTVCRVQVRRSRALLAGTGARRVRRWRRTVCRATLGTRARPTARLRRRCSVRPAHVCTMQRRGVRAVKLTDCAAGWQSFTMPFSLVSFSLEL